MFMITDKNFPPYFKVLNELRVLKKQRFNDHRDNLIISPLIYIPLFFILETS